MARKHKHSGLPTPKTDVVPIINVSLVVVLTLMIISPFLNKPELDVDLPDATTTETEDQDKVEILFARDGSLVVGQEAVTLETLEPTLAATFAEQPTGMAVVKADQGIAYGDVEAVTGQRPGGVEAAEAGADDHHPPGRLGQW